MAPIAFGGGAALADLENYSRESSSLEDAVKIGYIPFFEGYQKISKLVKANLSSEETLPPGFPSRFEGPHTWTASELTEDDWLVQLSQTDIESIESALKFYTSKYATVDSLSPETFPISEALKSKMKLTVSHLFDRRGFAVLRGLDSTKYTPLERAIIFLGLSSYVGSKLGVQTLSKSALSHLTNLKPYFAEGSIKSPGYTNAHMSFHNDTAHIIALFVVGVADNGGASMVASSAKVYNELASTKPHVLETLSSNWKLNRFSTHEFDSDDFYERPLLYYHGGRPILFIARRPFTGSNPSDNPIPLTLRQAEALDCVHFTAEPHALRIQLEKGDLQFLNNFAVIHSREDFRDSSIGEGSGRRHIIRAFIKNEERAYKMPDHLAGALSQIYPDLPMSELNFLIDPFGESVQDGGDPTPESPPRPRTPPPGPMGANG